MKCDGLLDAPTAVDRNQFRSETLIIPHRDNEKDKRKILPTTLYKARARIEQGFGRLKRFKRVALRCEKTARTF